MPLSALLLPLALAAPPPDPDLKLVREPVVMRNLVTGTDGAIWAEPLRGEPALFRWGGTGWAETPVKPLPHPVWTARPAPPWYRWAWSGVNRLYVLPGKNGGLLVVRIRDIFQDAAARGEAGPDDNWGKWSKLARKADEEGTPMYRLEAWLLRGGKWVGPADVPKLLVDERETLIRDFTTQVWAGTHFFSLVSSGGRLWATFDGKMLSLDADGTATGRAWPAAGRWDIPTPLKHPLTYTRLTPLADGKVWLLASSGEAGFDISRVLTWEGGKLIARQFAAPDGAQHAQTHDGMPFTTYRAADGTVWAWSRRAGVWRFRDGQWKARTDLEAPFHEDAKGRLWFRPPAVPPKLDTRVYAVTGDDTAEFAFPPAAQTRGFDAVPPGSVVFADEYRLLRLDPAGPDGKPALRYRVMSEYWQRNPVVPDGKGAILFGTWRAELGGKP